MKDSPKTIIAQATDQDIRIDKVLTTYFQQYSRQYLQKLIKEGHIVINKKKVKPNHLVQEKDTIEMQVPELQPLNLKATAIPLDIVFENKDLLVINKQPGLVTHPGVGTTHLDDSLVSALLHYCKGTLSGINGVLRPGIVHRLDKDTSGLLIVAKNDEAHKKIVDQMKNRSIKKVYQTLVVGKLIPKKGTIDAPIGRNPRNRKIMTILQEPKGRNALTHYEVLKYFTVDPKTELTVSLVQVHLVTGRTHQIRVHFASINHPVVGDTIYGRPKINAIFASKFDLQRQFLHAKYLNFILPTTNKQVSFEVPLPEDLQKTLEDLNKYSN